MGGIEDRTGLHHRLVNVTNLAEAIEPGSSAAVLTSRTSGPRLSAPSCATPGRQRTHPDPSRADRHRGRPRRRSTA